MAKLQVRESLSMAWLSLRANKLRTFLTLLGIIIGVLTVIAVVSVIQGLNNYVYTKMSFYGANDFSVQKFSMVGTSLKEFREQMKRKDLTLTEVQLLRDRCRSCDLIGATTSTEQTVKFGNQSLKNTEIRGVTYLDHEIGSTLELESGRHIQRQDETNSRPVCIIGADVVEKLYPTFDPLGRWIKVGTQNFQIIGTGKKVGKLLGFSQDNYVRIPITTFMKVYGARRSVSINIHTLSQEQMARAVVAEKVVQGPRRFRDCHIRDLHPVL
jgi:putative ABC transport system permease protein